MLRFLYKDSVSCNLKNNKLRVSCGSVLRRGHSDASNSSLILTNSNKFLPENQKVKQFDKEISDLKILKDFKQFQQEAKESLANIVELENHLSHNNPTLTALFHRLTLCDGNAGIKYHELATCLNCPDSELSTKFKDLPNNETYSSLGFSALKADILARTYLKYPRLPSSIADGVVLEFLGLKNLNNIGLTKFGLDLDRKTLLDSFLNKDGKYEIFGKVRSLSTIANNKLDKEIVQIASTDDKLNTDKIPIEYQPMSKAVLAIFGLFKLKAPQLFNVYASDIFSIEDLPIQNVFYLQNSIETLTNICKIENLSKPIFKLLTETGRYSSDAMFIVGVYTKLGEKLGEGYGKSLIDAKKRAALDASIKYLAYSPVLAKNDIAFGKGEVL